jgi:hypothetical protein
MWPSADRIWMPLVSFVEDKPNNRGHAVDSVYWVRMSLGMAVYLYIVSARICVELYMWRRCAGRQETLVWRAIYLDTYLHRAIDLDRCRHRAIDLDRCRHTALDRCRHRVIDLDRCRHTAIRIYVRRQHVNFKITEDNFAHIDSNRNVTSEHICALSGRSQNESEGILKFMSVCNTCMFIVICQWKTTAPQNVVIGNVSFWCENIPRAFQSNRTTGPNLTFAIICQ